MTRREVLGVLDGIAALPAVKAVECLRLQPGDSIVLKFQGRLPASAVERIRREFAEAFGGKFSDVPIIILENCADIVVLKKDGA